MRNHNSVRSMLKHIDHFSINIWEEKNLKDKNFTLRLEDFRSGK